VLLVPRPLLGSRLAVREAREDIFFIVGRVLLGGSAPAASQLVQDLPVRELKQPRTKRALLRVERRSAAPDSEKDFLNDLFRRGAVKTVLGQPEDDLCVTCIERPKRFLAADGKLVYQLLVSAR